MRNALILLAVVALVILAIGALNNGTTFEIDYVAGTISAVSLFWVSAVIAALVFVVGLAATWFALSGAAGGRRKLEAELQSTYERLREAEVLASRPAPVPEQPAVAATEVQEPPTAVVVEEATVVAGDDATVVLEETGEDATVVVEESVDDATVVAAQTLEDAPPEPGEQTAVTMTGEPAAGATDEAGGEEAASGQAPEEPTSDEPGDEPRASGS